MYLPVQEDGQWTIDSPGSWLQPAISTTSTPWYWVYPCAALDPHLVQGISTFMDREITDTFSGALATSLRSALRHKLAGATRTTCDSPDPNVAEGPPGPIRDRAQITTISISPHTASASAVIHVVDWQGGVTHTPASGGGREVRFLVVHGLLDASYSLRLLDGRWRVVTISTRFAPGHSP